MKIAFLGGVKFSYEILSTILEKKKNISIIFSYEDEKRKLFSDMVSLEDLAEKSGIKHLKVKNINDEENIDILKKIKPDLILVMGWSQLLKPEILQIPKLGVIGSHPTELPKYRGRAPIPWTIIKNLKESALTFFYIEEGIDNGDIVSQKKFLITEMDDATSLYKKICDIGKEMIIDTLNKLENRNLERKKQDSKYFIENWEKRTPEDGYINWSESVSKINTLIRASTNPYPGAFTFFKNHKLIIWKSSFEQIKSPGEGIISEISKEGIKVGAKDGIIIIHKANYLNREKLNEIFLENDLGKKLGK